MAEEYQIASRFGPACQRLDTWFKNNNQQRSEADAISKLLESLRAVHQSDDSLRLAMDELETARAHAKADREKCLQETRSFAVSNANSTNLLETLLEESNADRQTRSQQMLLVRLAATD